MLRDAAVIVAGYLLGSLPFAFVVTKALSGKDVRLEGEGSVGTRNAGFVAGPWAAVLVFLLDAGKGAAAYWVAHRWASGAPAFYLSALAMMLGHGFPVWLHWRGGKGLAAAAGFMLQMWPYSVLGGLVVYLVAGRLLKGFILTFALAALVFFLSTLLEGNDAEGLLFIVCLLGLAGVKKFVDLPYERAVQARAGRV